MMYDAKRSHQVQGRITFTDQKGQVMGAVPFELITDADNPSKVIPNSFKCVFSGILKYYATVKLEVDSITSVN